MATATTTSSILSPFAASRGPLEDDECCAASSSPLATLSCLTLQPVVPKRIHMGVHAALRLDRIEWLELVDPQRSPTDKTTYYTINVFIRTEQSRLPTSRLSHKPLVQRPVDTMAKPSRQDPDFYIQRSFADFKKLRDDTELAVQQGHGRYCQFCNAFQTLLVFTSARPAMVLKPLLPTETSLKAVQKLLVSLVAHFQARQATRGRRDACQAAREIPLRLYHFLFDDE